MLTDEQLKIRMFGKDWNSQQREKKSIKAPTAEEIVIELQGGNQKNARN